jgi:hypothetical protein
MMFLFRYTVLEMKLQLISIPSVIRSTIKTIFIIHIIKRLCRQISYSSLHFVGIC